ncbi:hypothetical protein ABEX38_29140 [Priestia megaterium]
MITNTNIKKHYELSEDLFTLLTNLHKKYKPNNYLNINTDIQFDSTASDDSVIKDISEKLYELTKQALVLQEVFNLKFYYLYDALIYSINRENYLMLAENARALFEHIGTLAYLSIETEKISQNFKNTNDAENFLIDFSILINHYQILFYNTVSLQGGKLVDKEDNELLFSKLFPTYISLSLSHHEEKVLKNDFMFLSDFVHPNLGSNLLVTNGYLKKESNIYISDEERSNIIEKLLASIHRLLEMSRDLEIRFIRAGLKIQDMYRISLNKHDSVEGLFSPLIASKGKFKAVVGDGKTANTAINFPIARSIAEEIELCSIYIRQNDLEKRSYKFEYIKGGWMYYSYRKRNQKVWFKKKFI